jgi:hypothetical protein
MAQKVGLIVGREWSFPPAFIEEVNKRDQGVVAEYVKLGGTRMDDLLDYAVIIDRISHEVPYYRSVLKHAMLHGTTVVNNPFMWTADDKFFESSLATKLGVASPKTVVLPNKDYVPGIVRTESLRNLIYPMDWQAVIDYVGLPCVLKDAHGGGWRDVYICHSLEELWQHYDGSGLLTMIVQEFIEWDHYVRCLVLGQTEVLPIKYDPKERKYHVEHEHLSPELGKRIVDDSLKLVRALGYDMNSVEWAMKDGVPYALDFMNPAPDMDIYSLTPHYFQWAVEHMADMAIRLAKENRGQVGETKWSGWFNGRMEGAGALAAVADKARDVVSTAVGAVSAAVEAAPKPPRRRKAADIPTELENTSTEGDATLAELAPAEPPGRTRRSTSAAQGTGTGRTSSRSRRSTAATQGLADSAAEPADMPSKPRRSRSSTAGSETERDAGAARRHETPTPPTDAGGAAGPGGTERFGSVESVDSGEAPTP